MAWAEALTQLQNKAVPDEVYSQARQQFSEDELIDLTLAVVAINSFNRLNIAFKTPAGNYVPGQFASILN